MRPRTHALPALLAALALLVPTTGCGEVTGTAQDDRPGAGVTAAGDPAPTGPERFSRRRVLAVSIDGLNPRALRRLGEERAPTLHRLLREGAGTRNARTMVEMTVTLPNHTSMVTGRRIDRDRRGHGVTWNEHLPGTTVQGAARHPVASVFRSVRAAGGSSALFAAKQKFSLFERSWDAAIDRFRIDERQGRLVRAARRDLVRKHRALTFVHFALPDRAGHAHGFMGPAYLRAVERTDRLLGRLVSTIDHRPRLRRLTVVVLTADHGGRGARHGDADLRSNYRVPFVVWGAGIEPADLYDLNPDYRDPGRRQPDYAGRQPVRNGDLANVVTGLLGLDPVRGSQFGKRRTLDVS